MPTSTIKVIEVEPQPVAVVRDRANLSDLGQKITQHSATVWAFIRNAGSVKSDGSNVVLYHDEPSKGFLLRDEGIPVEIGAQVLAPFTSTSDVVCSTTPGGMVATATHVGPHYRLHETHNAIRDWCRENNRTMAGPNWEVYGHWSDDPDQLQTDVFYLLQE